MSLKNSSANCFRKFKRLQLTFQVVYATALLSHFGQWMHPERRQDKGPKPKPRWMPLPELLYAQVVKSYRRRRLVGVTHRVVFGTQLAIEQVLTACGWTINTAFVERLNLDIRQRVAAIGRRVNTLCQGEAGLREQLALFQVYHNFVLPHVSLRQPLPVAEATNGGSAKVWRPCTPAMAAGLTDHVWSLTEVSRVPPVCGSFHSMKFGEKPPSFTTCGRGFCHGLRSLFLRVRGLHPALCTTAGHRIPGARVCVRR